VKGAKRYTAGVIGQRIVLQGAKRVVKSSQESMMVLRIPPTVAPTGFPPVAETLTAAVEKIVASLHPQKIILFGSYAYGHPTPDSDVDLLVIMETDKPPRERVVAVSLVVVSATVPCRYSGQNAA
jgi:hypothetical protein